MADYKGLLRKAVDALPENNGAARRNVYEKARNALVAQLRVIDPPLPSREITQHRLQLEDCIREVELEATETALGNIKAVETAGSSSSVSLAPAGKPNPTVPGAKSEPEKPETAAGDQKPAEGSSTTPSEPEKPKAELPSWAKPRTERASASSDETKSSGSPPDEAEAETDPVEPEDGATRSDEPAVPDWAKPVEQKPDADSSSNDAAETSESSGDAGPAAVEVSTIEDIIAQAERSRSVSSSPAPASPGEDEEPESDRLSDGAAPYSGTAPATRPGEDGELATASLQSGSVSAPAVPQSNAEVIASRLGNRSDADVGTAMSSVLEVDVEADGDRDAQGAIDRAIETLDREARGEHVPLGEDTSESQSDAELDQGNQEALPAADSEDDEEGGGNALTIFLVLLVLLLGGSGGAAYWAWQEGYLDPETLFAQVTLLGGNGGTAETPVADTSETASEGPGNTTTGVDTELGEGELPKSGERLDGVEDTTTPAVSDTPEQVLESAATGDQTTADDGAAGTDALAFADPNGTAEVAVATDTPDTTGSDVVADEPTPGANGETEADKSEERLPGTDTTEDAASIEPETDTAMSGSQSLLLEASGGSTGAVPFSGTIEWSRGVDELDVPTIIAIASIPARNLEVEVLIRKNSDETLPASHLMEINFSVSETFVGGAIAGLPGILLKNEELVQGVPLVGASARVVGNSFLFALSGAEQDMQTNLNLLADRKWMDLALIYATGRRAIITLEKDETAEAMVAGVLAEWQAIDDAAANEAEEAAAAAGSTVDASAADTATDLLADEGVDTAQ